MSQTYWRKQRQLTENIERKAFVTNNNESGRENKTFSDESEKPPATSDPSWEIDEQFKLVKIQGKVKILGKKAFLRKKKMLNKRKLYPKNG